MEGYLSFLLYVLSSSPSFINLAVKGSSNSWYNLLYYLLDTWISNNFILYIFQERIRIGKVCALWFTRNYEEEGVAEINCPLPKAQLSDDRESAEVLIPASGKCISTLV